MPSKPGGIEAGEPLLLTPLIEADQLQQARAAAYCPPDQLLPGLNSYAGYLTVRDQCHLLVSYATDKSYLLAGGAEISPYSSACKASGVN